MDGARSAARTIQVNPFFLNFSSLVKCIIGKMLISLCLFFKQE
jgi:hypothetical protein